MATFNLEQYGSLKDTHFWAIEIDSFTNNEQVVLNTSSCVYRPITDSDVEPSKNSVKIRSVEIYTNDNDHDNLYNGLSSISFDINSTTADFYIDINDGGTLNNSSVTIKNLSGVTQYTLVIIVTEEI
jgi:hypothetical protein